MIKTAVTRTLVNYVGRSYLQCCKFKNKRRQSCLQSQRTLLEHPQIDKRVAQFIALRDEIEEIKKTADKYSWSRSRTPRNKLTGKMLEFLDKPARNRQDRRRHGVSPPFGTRVAG